MNKRIATYPVDKIFIDRWSARSLIGESISDEELMTLFEASRWAPSTYNSQPWRFIYAKRATPYWETLFNLLQDANQLWARNAAVLVVIVSKTINSHGPLLNHSFDTGAAWQNMALQAHLRNLVAHGIGGFDSIRTKEELYIPQSYTVEAMVAIGKRDKKEALPLTLQQREEPSGRKPLTEIVFEGLFRKG